jgi:hypothetical protein
MAQNDKKVTKAVNQNQQSNVNKSVDSQNKQEPRFQPTRNAKDFQPVRSEEDFDDKVKGDAGMDAKRKAAREAELAEQAPQTRLHTGADEKPEQPDGAKTADSVNPVEANSLAAHVQPTATKAERDRAEREFDKENKAEQVPGGQVDLRTATTAEKDALSSRTGLEPAAAATEVKESVSTDKNQDSNKGSRKFL